MDAAVVVTLFAAYKVVDLLTVSFEKQKEIVNSEVVEKGTEE